jgi:HAD superfamily hydrolase (TIGR01509 family)
VVRAVLFDVDGTLVDSNDAHAHAWVRAFADFGVTVAFDAVRRSIGMGGDKLMPKVSGIAEDSEKGRQIANRRKAIFANEFLPNLQPLRGSAALVAAMRRLGLTVVAASSAKKEELKYLLRIAGADTLLHGATSSDDAEESKPEPDIVEAALALAKVSPDAALMVGDTPYDIEAAQRAGVRAIAFRSGGWTDAELRGAIAIYDGPWDLLRRLDDSPIVAEATDDAAQRTR